MGFPGSSAGREFSVCGQRSLAGYSSWGHKELDRTERLNTVYRIYVSPRSSACCVENSLEGEPEK